MQYQQAYGLQNTPVMNTQYYRNNISILTSRSVERVTVGRRDCRICYGDRISVRAVMNGRPVAEYITSMVADFTDLTGDLRRRMRKTKGLVTVYVRNLDRGWNRELRIMLYGERKYSPATRVTAVQTPMFFPWEL